MVKIPRYKEGTINFQTTQTDLGEGKIASGSATNFANNVRQLAVETHKQKTNLEAKLRRLEINTNKDLGTSLVYKDVTEYNDSLLDREDYLTPDNWLNDYNNNVDKWKKKYKKQFDEQTWTELEPIFNSTIFEGRTKINQQIRSQKIKNAGVAYNQSVETFKDQIDKAEDPSQITAAWLSMQDIIKRNRQSNLFDDEVATLQYFELENLKDQAIAWLAVKESELIQNPFGNNETNWEGVLNNLKQKDEDGEYLYVPSLDPDLRKIMISEAESNFSNQTNTHQSMLDKKNKVVKNDFISEFVEIRNGTENGQELARDFATRVSDSSLMPSEKTALLNNFYSWQNSDKTTVEPWETAQGTQATTLANMFVYSGLIDTETERSFLTEIYGNQLISNEMYSKLNNKIDDNIKEKNQYKKTLYKSAILMLADEIGSKELSTLLQDVQGMDAADLMLALQTNYGKEVYDTINYFNQVLAHGESQGFNYVNMLSNQSSPNYIMNNILEFSKEAVKNKSGDYTKFDWITNIDKDKPFALATGVWFEGKQPILPNYEIPLRKENETIPQYLNRVKKEFTAKSLELPSVISGTQFEEDFDFNTLNILPDLQE